MKFNNIIIILCLFLSMNTNGQDYGYTLLSDTIEVTGSGGIIEVEDIPLPHQIHSAKIFISIDPINSRYIYQFPTSQLDATFVLNYGTSSPYNVTIGGNVAQRIIVEEIPFTNSTLLSSLADIELSSIASDPNLTLTMRYEIEVGIEVNPTTSINNVTLNQNENLSGEKLKSVTLSWEDSNEHPNYEIQILKLSSEVPIVDEYQSVIVDFDNDWERALRFTTDGHKDEVAITLGEGSGFYVARMRPVGTYYNGGISDHRNFGVWDYTPLGPTSFDINALSNRAIFFFDPDDDINWIYNRVFTESSRIKENYTIADPLLNVRQSQTNLPSQDVILITESQIDYAGRPSMSTIPVPITNENGLVFKNQFFQPANTTGDIIPIDTLYRPEHFDKEDNLLDPKVVFDDQEGYDYYSQNNPDYRLPSAEGYPYSRTLFERDLTNRVQEQSGVGKVHMVSPSQTNEAGRTIRTYYGTASEEELVRLFGDEAPRASSVTKTVTLDQNNVAQVQFSNMAGKVIATGLIENIDDYNSDNLLPLNHHTSNAGYTIEDILDVNIIVEGGMLASKRFVLMEESPFSYTYTLDCPQLEEACHNVIIDCNWDLEVRIINIHDPTQPTIIENHVLSTMNCDVNNQKVVSGDQIHTLQSGTYIIEKRLTRASNEIDADIEDARDKIEMQINPIVNAVTTELENICTQEDVDNFYDFLIAFANDLNDLSDNPSPAGNEDLINQYDLNSAFEVTEDHNIILYPSSGQPHTMIIQSQCCVGIEVDVTFVPQFQCPEDFTFNLGSNNQLDVNPDFNNSEWPADFEGYARYLLDNKCDFPNPVDTFYKYTAGWGEGELNWMVHHMLSDQYNCNGPQSSENPDPNSTTPSSSGDCLSSGIGGIGPYCDVNDNCTQYTCEELFNCWDGVLRIFIERACTDLSGLYDNTNDSPTVSDAVDEENDDDPPGSEQDSHIDDNISGFMKFVMWITGASGKMRDEQDDVSLDIGETWGERTLNLNLVQEFLDCTGYRFADVITTENYTSIMDDISSHNTLSGPYDNTSYNPNPVISGGCNTRKDCWSPTDPFDDSKKIFQNIPNNIFAFKYYYYQGHYKYVLGTPILDPNLITLELQTCYNDPNLCDDGSGNLVPCCPGLNSEDLCEFCDLGVIECDITHEDWSCGQRLTFYEMLKNYRNIGPPPAPELFDCNDDPGKYNFIVPKVQSMQENCNGACDQRRTLFKNELLKTLRERCYNIGECRGYNEDANIPWEDVDAMVDALVTQCKSQCEITTYACITDKKCISTADAYQLNPVHETRQQILIGVGGGPADICGSNPIDNADDVSVTECTNTTSFSYCDLTEWEQAVGWNMELEIPSHCHPDSSGFVQHFQCTNDVDHFCVDRDIVTEVYSPYGEPDIGALKDSTDTKIITVINN